MSTLVKPSELIRREISENLLPIYGYFTVSQLIEYFHEKPKTAVICAIHDLEKIGKVKILKEKNVEFVIYNASFVSIDKNRIRAFWILLNILENQDIELHLPGKTGGFVKINFVFNDIHYEIYHCPKGKESILNTYMKTTDEYYKSKDIIPKKIIMVDDYPQTKNINGYNIYAYATATLEGDVAVYNAKNAA